MFTAVPSRVTLPRKLYRCLTTVATSLRHAHKQQVSGHGIVLFLVSLSLNKRVSDVTMKKRDFTEIDRVKYPTG